MNSGAATRTREPLPQNWGNGHSQLRTGLALVEKRGEHAPRRRSAAPVKSEIPAAAKCVGKSSPRNRQKDQVPAVDVRNLARRRQATRLRYAAACRLAWLSRETCIPLGALRRFVSIGDPRSAHRVAVSAFHARGERAWQRYIRDGAARPIDEVFDKINGRFEAAKYANASGRREFRLSVGALLAQGATRVVFPPSPPAEDWESEPEYIGLSLKPADLDN